MLTVESLIYKPIGYICITDNFRLASTKKPNIFHRIGMRLILGWVWKDNTGD